MPETTECSTECRVKEAVERQIQKEKATKEG